MLRKLPRTRSLVLCCLLALSACGSKDTKAADAAARAESFYNQGQFKDASTEISKALEARDDVSEYWVLLGKIATAGANYGLAFTAYENALSLDHANADVLRALCEVTFALSDADNADKYADQLLLVSPNEVLAKVTKGRAALLRHDDRKALEIAEGILAANPLDTAAQVLKGRVLANRGDYAEAARYIAGAPSSGKDETLRVKFLKDMYARSNDFPRYEAAVRRLAAINPDDPVHQLALADLLYQIGQPAAANQLLSGFLAKRPNDISVASDAVEIWLKQGPDALTPQQIREQSAKASLEMKAAYARFAIETSRPEIAIEILPHELATAAPTVANSNAKAALAYAEGLRGRSDAIGRLSAILAFDSEQPLARLARARLRAQARDFGGALEDARAAVAQDPKSASARITLSDILLAHGETMLAESALREGFRAMPANPRMAVRLVEWLTSHNQRDAANDVLREFVRADTISPRARRIHARLNPDEKLDFGAEPGAPDAAPAGAGAL